MGYRCHVATTYQVKYDHGYFSYQQECINSLLNDLCPGLWCNDEGVDFSNELEIPKDELKAAIDTIKESKEEYAKDLDKKNADFTVDELIENMETWLKESDSNNDYVRLSWF